jgi:hypothetical protein
VKSNVSVLGDISAVGMLVDSIVTPLLTVERITSFGDLLLQPAGDIIGNTLCLRDTLVTDFITPKTLSATTVNVVGNLSVLDRFDASTICANEAIVTDVISPKTPGTSLCISGGIEITGDLTANVICLQEALITDVILPKTNGANVCIQGNLDLDTLYVHEIAGKSPIEIVDLLELRQGSRAFNNIVMEAARMVAQNGGGIDVNDGGNVMMAGGGQLCVMDGGEVEVSGGGRICVTDGGDVEVSGGGQVCVADSGDVIVEGGCFRLRGTTSAVIYEDTGMTMTQELLGTSGGGSILTLMGYTYGPTFVSVGGIALYVASDFSASSNIDFMGTPDFSGDRFYSSGYTTVNMGPIRNVFLNISIGIISTGGGNSTSTGTIPNFVPTTFAASVQNITCYWRAKTGTSSGVGSATIKTSGEVDFAFYNLPGNATYTLTAQAVIPQVI